MANGKKTVFQRLDSIFGPDGIKVPRSQTNRYTLGNQELLRTGSKEDYEAAKLQAKQMKDLL